MDLVKFICRETSAKKILTKLVRRCIIVLRSSHDFLVCREESESFIGNYLALTVKIEQGNFESCAVHLVPAMTSVPDLNYMDRIVVFTELGELDCR